MYPKRFLSPRNDLCFKRIFGTERNKDILIHFLNDLLKPTPPIQDVTFLKTIQDPEIAPHRVSIVDVMCQDQNGDRFVIEMQLSHEEAFDRRALYYATKAYCSQRQKDVEYKDLKDVYFLAVTDFCPFPKKKHWFSRIGLKDLDTNEHDIKAIQLFFMQLPLFKKGKEDLKTMTINEKWAYFFKYADDMHSKELEELIGEDLIIKRAYEEVDRFNWTDNELLNYESVELKHASNVGVRDAAFNMGFAEGQEKGKVEGIAEGVEEGIKLGIEQGIEQGIEKGIEQGIEKGVKEGERKKSIEVAKCLLAQCLAISQISTITGLSEEEIELLTEEKSPR
ncbi:MAG: Rpn family recombination-promoting nuclease/putative transposase [Chlamydiia bacterium]|nr:Rpn family recombination-promoting nuclease/putative transposase [Chlamydiia bacterium]